MEYPKYVVQRLLNMIRVKLNAPGMIDNEKGELDSSVRPALVYYVQAEIISPDSYNAGMMNDILAVGGAQCLYTIGR